jgi:hypothetical protein
MSKHCLSKHCLTAVHALKALGCPIVVALEGGYNCSIIGQAIAAVTRVLLGEAPAPLITGELSAAGYVRVISVLCSTYKFFVQRILVVLFCIDISLFLFAVLAEQNVLNGGDGGVYYGAFDEIDAAKQLAFAADRKHTVRLLTDAKQWRKQVQVLVGPL